VSSAIFYLQMIFIFPIGLFLINSRCAVQ